MTFLPMSKDIGDSSVPVSPDEETIQFLLDTRWWDQDVEWLRQHWELLCDINELKIFMKKKG